jgi:uncharacterized protein YceK
MTAVTVLFAVIILAAASSGCASSVQDDSKGQTGQEAYLSAYIEGMDHHGGQDY